MKITCNRRDDIIKRRDEYDVAYNEQQAKHDAQVDKHRKAVYEVTSAIEDEIRNQIVGFVPGVRVNVRDGWGDGLEVSIQDEDRLHDESKSLSWNYSVSLGRDGEVKKKTSSWSGLNATTEENLADLQNILEALKILNKMDWNVILHTAVPKWEDYVTERSPSRNDRPNFEQELMEADLEDAVGSDVLVHGKATEASGYRGTGYYLLLKETPAQYTALFLSEWHLSNYLQRMSLEELIAEMKKNFRPFRIQKAKAREIFGKEIKFYQEGQE